MREFFGSLPANGPVRLSKSFLNRLGGAAERADRMSVTSNGTVTFSQGRSGPSLVIDTGFYVFAEITAEHSEAFPGYSWQQRRPGPREDDTQAGPTWVPTDPMLSGDNGSEAAGPASATVSDVESTSGLATLTTLSAHEFVAGDMITVSGLTDPNFNGTFRVVEVGTNTISYYVDGSDVPHTGDSGLVEGQTKPRRDVAVDFGGDTNIEVGTKVLMVRGYVHTPTTNAEDLSLLDPDNPDGGSSVDAEAAEGTDWIILWKSSTAVVEGTVAVRISGRSYRVDDSSTPATVVRHYPGVIRARLGTPTTFMDTAPPQDVWVVNVNNALMGTTGDFVVEANSDGFATVNGDTRPRYWTTDRIVQADFNCDNQQATYTGLWEGDVLGPDIYPDDIFPKDIFPKPLFP